MAKNIKKLLIWDGNNLFRRCAGNKGLARLTFKGRPTGAIHGTVKGVLTEIQELKPDECVIVFDGKGARARKQKIYAGYKAQRESSMDESLHHQMMITRDILKAAGLCVLQKDGVDADDAIGALATIPNRSVLVSSNDKDFLQLCSGSCSTIRNLGNGPEIWDQYTVRKRFGVNPNQIADYLALCGDGIDGIPGLKGCGPVNAVQFLNEYGTIKDIVKNRKHLGPRWSKAIASQIDDLKLFYRLTLLDTSVISPTAMETILPRLVPGKYSPELKALCELHGLTWLQKWFLSHRPTVLSSTRGLWS